MATKQEKQWKFGAAETAAFCDQIAIILNSGIPLYEGTYIMSQEMEDGKTRQILEGIDEAVKANVPFFQALEESHAFPSYMVQMVRVGEFTGKLEEVMALLAKYYERESVMKASIKNIITYPIMLFGIMAVILLVLVSKILPMFQRVFEELNTDAVKSSSSMMSAGMVTGKIVAVVTAAFVVLIAALVLWYQTEGGKQCLTGAANRFIVTRGLAEKMGTGQFISAMSLMISSGIDTKEALDIVKDVVRNPVVKRRCEECLNKVSGNESLPEALQETGMLRGVQERMVYVGARTGALDSVFEKLSIQYNDEIEERLTRVSSIVETVLVIALSLIVGAILISVMMPLVSIISSIG